MLPVPRSEAKEDAVPCCAEYEEKLKPGLSMLTEHGQEMVRMVHPNGSIVEIHKFGATVTRYMAASGREVLWVSEQACARAPASV